MSLTELPEPAGRDLTPRQRKIVQVIQDAVQRDGYPPTQREIGNAAGLASTSSVSHQLAVLERKGYLSRGAGRPRTAVVYMSADGEATVKTFKKSGEHAWLLPHNPGYTPILGDDAKILGKMVTVLRRV